MPDINWYPGHMAKTRRLLEDQIRSVDAVIELTDARAPQAARNPELNAMARGKARILVLNKADLADDAATARWLAEYRARGLRAVRFNANGGKTREIYAEITAACASEVARMKAKGVNKTVRMMVAGIPNVGKSTFVNRLLGRNSAAVSDRPGVTRAPQWIRVEPYLELLDTPGMLWPKLNDQNGARLLAFLGSVRDGAIDAEALAEALLKTLMRIAPELARSRFRVEPSEDESLLESACRGRGWLLSGGRCDTTRGAALVLDEFRAGRVGRVTLQRPDDWKRTDES